MRFLLTALADFFLRLAAFFDRDLTIEAWQGERDDVPDVEIIPGIHAMGAFAEPFLPGRGKYPGLSGNSHQRRIARRARKYGAL